MQSPTQQVTSGEKRLKWQAWGWTLLVHAVLLSVAALAVRSGLSRTSAPPQVEAEVSAEPPVERPEGTAADTEHAVGDATAAVPAPHSDERDLTPLLPGADDLATLLLPDIRLPDSAVKIPAPDERSTQSLELRGPPQKPVLPGSDEDLILSEPAEK